MATSASPPPATAVPAQLGFLAIFNPTLGATDENIDDQIVYYSSVNTQTSRRRHRSRAKPTDKLSQEERNERLRQIGLAQGMVEFSRSFSSGESVDTIDTEKSRVVVHELEPGWWILASVDLTKLPLPPRLGASAIKTKDDASDNVEYSSREVKPPALLLQDLLRAHSVFLLHHAASLSELFVRFRRDKFVIVLRRYWDLWLSTWNVMLQGNPACAIFGGIKLAASGELGVGVGEEERGSGERDVLEGFVGRIEGLVDVVVSKFGVHEPENSADQTKDRNLHGSSDSTWLGTGEEPGAEDGAIFLGVGALSRKSLRDITYWMEDMYAWGEDAYGIKENVTSTRAKRRAKAQSVNDHKPSTAQTTQSLSPVKTDQGDSKSQFTSTGNANESTDEGSMNKFMGYLKMGYGTHWSLGNSGSAHPEDSNQEQIEEPGTSQQGQSTPLTKSRRSSKQSDETGHYLIGLKGDFEEIDSDSTEDRELDRSQNSRTLLRTLTVELESEAQDRPEANVAHDLGSQDNELSISRSGRKDCTDSKSHFDSQDRNKTKKMRVVVYASRPFIYTFVFQNHTDSLAWSTLYKSLHYQLAPLRKSLVLSTTFRPEKPDVEGVSTHIFDLIWDPRAMTVQSTIPSIPEPASMRKPQDDQKPPPWSRVEGMSTHVQILNTYIATRLDNTDLERTCKTGRGWWVVWTRIMDDDTNSPVSTPKSPSEDSKKLLSTIDSASSFELCPVKGDQSTESLSSGNKTAAPDVKPAGKPNLRRRKLRRNKEIFLIRRAGEHGTGVSGSYAESGGWADGATRLAQGIGVDTKKYVEGLLSPGG